MKIERGFKDYLAGATVAFCIVILTSQVLLNLLGGQSAVELISTNNSILVIICASNLAGGVIGGYLVARHGRMNYIQTGTMIAVIAYLFEFIYSFVIERLPLDIFVLVSLLVGGIIGSVFFRLRLERVKLLKKTKGEVIAPSESVKENEPTSLEFIICMLGTFNSLTSLFSK